VSLTIPFVSRRDRRKHSPDTIIRNLRDENVRLLNRQAAADDFFAILLHDVTTTNTAWQQEKQLRQLAETELAQAEAAIRLRDQIIADLKRKVDVGVKAEHIIAKTQELDPEQVRRYCVKPLHQSPLAVTDPGRVPPSWAVPNEPADATA
jgi:hypothetical protein